MPKNVSKLFLSFQTGFSVWPRFWISTLIYVDRIAICDLTNLYKFCKEIGRSCLASVKSVWRAGLVDNKRKIHVAIWMESTTGAIGHNQHKRTPPGKF